MLMNKTETLLVTSPANRTFQRWVEAPILRRLGGRTPGARALEIGCGSGYGTKLIIDQFGAATVDAIDLDPAMVDRARHRLRRYRDQVRVVQGSADDLQTALGAEDSSYDAVFDFGIIHHVTNWRDAVAEVARVLKPGGQFYFLEVTAAALARPSYRRLLGHPIEDRFTAGQFLAELSGHGLDPADSWRTYVGSDYLAGVALLS
jgi:ubiquinone/menaquinone biosynthesis C-methylase UbiE